MLRRVFLFLLWSLSLHHEWGYPFPPAFRPRHLFSYCHNQVSINYSLSWKGLGAKKRRGSSFFMSWGNPSLFPQLNTLSSGAVLLTLMHTLTNTVYKWLLNKCSRKRVKLMRCCIYLVLGFRSEEVWERVSAVFGVPKRKKNLSQFHNDIASVGMSSLSTVQCSRQHLWSLLAGIQSGKSLDSAKLSLFSLVAQTAAGVTVLFCLSRSWSFLQKHNNRAEKNRGAREEKEGSPKAGLLFLLMPLALQDLRNSFRGDSCGGLGEIDASKTCTI